MTSAQKPIITSALWIGALLAIISNVYYLACYICMVNGSPLYQELMFFCGAC